MQFQRVGIPHLCRVDQLVRPCPGRGNGGAVNTTRQAALGDDLEGRLCGSAERIDVGYVGLEVVCVRGVVLLHLGLSSFLGKNIKDLSRLGRQHAREFCAYRRT